MVDTYNHSIESARLKTTKKPEKIMSASKIFKDLIFSLILFALLVLFIKALAYFGY
jgi:hypothetical protein